MSWRTLVAVVVLSGFCVASAAADDDNRNVWNYSANGRAGSFTRDAEGWIEEFEFKGKNVFGGGRDRYVEAERTDEYVELTGERFRSVRLYADHEEQRLGDGDWSRLWAGSWADTPTIVGRTGARSAKLKTGSASPKAPQVWKFAIGNQTGYFSSTGNGWSQQINTMIDGRVVVEQRQFSEQSRTVNYVELIDNQNLPIRLYADRAEVDSGNGTWRLLYAGSWAPAATAQAATVAAAPDSASPTPAVGTERVLWKFVNQKNSTGTIRRTAKGWIEEKQVKVGTRTRMEVMMYVEANTTPDYIELFDERRNITNRIYADHTEWRMGEGPWITEFAGSWVSEE
jgi:hypothetical protein